MAESLILINESRVKQLLDWNVTFDAMELALRAVSERRVFQNPRSFTAIPNSGNVLLSMPGYLENGNRSVLATKLVTSFPTNRDRNPPLSTIMANIFLFDTETGQLKCILEGSSITAWRTAGASMVATRYLHGLASGKKSDVLAVVGAGTQGRIHAIGLQHMFQFKQVKMWNRTPSRAEKVVKELVEMGIPAVVSPSVEQCVKDADVIVTATYASSPLINLAMIKTNAHINAIGAGQNHHAELSEDIYKNSIIYVDHLDGARVELKGLLEAGLNITELGEVIIKKLPTPTGKNITIYHSLGMAAEDAAIGQALYERHITTK